MPSPNPAYPPEYDAPDEYSPEYEAETLRAFLRNPNYEYEEEGVVWRAWPASDVDAVLSESR